MKYYGFIKNNLGELVLFTEAFSRIEVETELATLTAAGFPKERTLIVSTKSAKVTVLHAFINFVTADGEVVEYSIHSTDIRHEFLVAAELICRRQFNRIVAAELRDNTQHLLCRVELGGVYVPDKPIGRIALQTQTLERFADKRKFR